MTRIENFDKKQIRPDGKVYCVNETEPFTGEFISYSNKKRESSEKYENGVIIEKSKNFFDSKQIEKLEIFKNGKKTLEKEFYKNGVIKVEIDYIKDKSKVYFESGNLQKELSVDKYTQHKKFSKIIKISLFVVGFLFFSYIIGGKGDNHSSSSYLYTAERELKDNLYDPSSYERISYSETSTYVKIKYRAKNGFGALIIDEAIIYKK